MYDPERRKDCPMRGNLGNCSPVGGFCMDAVSDEICEAVHNAYSQGFYNAVRMLKEHEPKTGHWIESAGDDECSVCGATYSDLYPDYQHTHYCPNCGAKMIVQEVK